MKSRVLLILFSICCVAMGGLLFMKEDEPLKIITSQNIYSYKQTTLVETVPIHILINKEDSYLGVVEYVSTIELVSDDEIIPLIVKDIVQSNNEYVYNSTTYYQMTYFVQIGFNSNDMLLSFDDCLLHVRYQNDQEFSVDIGSFYYLFDDSLNDDVSLGNYMATVTEYNDKKTVSGLHIELYNSSRSNITIKKLELYSRDVMFNNQYSLIYDDDIDMFVDVSSIVGEGFISTKEEVQVNEHLLRMNNYVRIYIPVSYLKEDVFLHRAMIKVTYEKDGNIYEESIDDFPFISTSIFTSEYENGFRYYEYPN